MSGRFSLHKVATLFPPLTPEEYAALRESIREHGVLVPILVHKANDRAQTRAAMRALGIQKIVVTPTETGWSSSGDGNLSGLVGGNGDTRRSPRHPPPVTRAAE